MKYIQVPRKAYTHEIRRNITKQIGELAHSKQDE
jgi:hypothetical protein